MNRSLVLSDGAQEFARYLSGRRVVVVGPARTLIGQGRGASIDAYDVVVRFNEAFAHGLSTSAVRGDFGSRTDLCYSNQVVLRREILADDSRRRRFLRCCSGGGLRFIVCTNNSLSFDATGAAADGCPAADRQVPSDVAALMDGGGAAGRVRVAYSASRALHRWLEGHWARTGFVALFDLLTFDLAGLHVTGMTFYHGGGHLLAPGAGTLHPTRNRDGSSSLDAVGRGHDSRLELEAMRWLTRCFPRTLSVDAELRRLLR